MLLSSCVVWRHADWEDFRAECPGGDPELQRLVWERLDDALEWLVSLGAEPVWQDTENPLTTGKRFDPRALTALLARDVQLLTPLPADVEPPLVLATGGFRKRLAAERGLLLRANPWSDGAALDYATARGAAADRGDGGVLRPRHAGAAGADRRGGLRLALAALRPLGARVYGRGTRHHARRRCRGRRTTSRSDRRSCLVRARRRRARAGARASRGGACRRRHGRRSARAAVRDARRLTRRGARRRRGHAHDRGHSRSTRRRGRSTASSSPVSMRAASRPAATRAASRRRSSSASSLLKR